MKRTLAAVPDDPPVACERCRERDRIMDLLRAQIRELREQNGKLTRAVQREAYHFDARVVRNKD